MSAPLADLRARVVDRVLDFVWDVTLPVSTRCPVCAFWRGVLAGIGLTLLAFWIVL
jgi:hypothetical protein